MQAVKWVFLGLFGAAVVVVTMMSSQRSTPAPAVAVLSDAECLADLDCAYRRAVRQFGDSCRQQVERFAKYSLRWIDPAARWDRRAWSDDARRAIVIGGDQLELQNGFGAWQRHAYRCVVDLSMPAVIDVEVRPGRA